MEGFKDEDSPIVTLFQWRLIVRPSHRVLVPTFGRVACVTVKVLSSLSVDFPLSMVKFKKLLNVRCFQMVIDLSMKMKFERVSFYFGLT